MLNASCITLLNTVLLVGLSNVSALYVFLVLTLFIHVYLFSNHPILKSQFHCFILITLEIWLAASIFPQGWEGYNINNLCYFYVTPYVLNEALPAAWKKRCANTFALELYLALWIKTLLINVLVQLNNYKIFDLFIIKDAQRSWHETLILSSETNQIKASFCVYIVIDQLHMNIKLLLFKRTFKQSCTFDDLPK